jgi:mRNA-degrading endonuclease RelE of RelBE toxin-antitoxin system
MTLTFVEASDFTDLIAEYFGTDEHYLKLQAALIRNPETGSVIPGTGGLRKVRWPDPRRGKGKRGGLRVIYLYIPSNNVIGFVDVYDKDESGDLSAAGKQTLSTLATLLRHQYGKPW